MASQIHTKNVPVQTNGRRSACEKMHGSPITYEEAIARIECLASSQRQRRKEAIQLAESTASPCNATSDVPHLVHMNDPRVSTLSLTDAVGWSSLDTITAPISTPMNDTSAMDGFAVCTALTVSASPEKPVKFRVVDVVAAGDVLDKDQTRKQLQTPRSSVDASCVEIMTGACFPELTYPELDGVVKIEDVVVIDDWVSGEDNIAQYILISSPVQKNQNRRFAGSDIRKGNLVVLKGTVIEPKHVMTLASLGIGKIEVCLSPTMQDHGIATSDVYPGLCVGVLSTGSEIVKADAASHSAAYDGPIKQQVFDCNGPYLVAAMKRSQLLSQVNHLGVVKDVEEALTDSINNALSQKGCDVIVSSGGVSMGRFDLVRHVVESRLGGKVLFHGVFVRPGLPVLLAIIPCISNHNTKVQKSAVYFGLPGNPIATAMALRFFVMPYLHYIQHGTSSLEPRRSTLCLEGSVEHVRRTVVAVHSGRQKLCGLRKKPIHFSVFLLSRFRNGDSPDTYGTADIEVLSDQASYKTSVLLSSDCWVMISPGRDVIADGDSADFFPL